MSDLTDFMRDIQHWNRTPPPRPMWWWSWKLVSRPFNALVYLSAAGWLLEWPFMPKSSWEVWFDISNREAFGIAAGWYCAVYGTLCVVGAVIAAIVHAMPAGERKGTVLD